MFANRYTVFVDACSLASVWRRNLLLSLAAGELYRVRWSPDVLAELERTLVKLFHPDPLAADDAKRAVHWLGVAFPEASVEDYDGYLPAAMVLPDEGDRHVLAAAAKSRASMLVTENLKDFPESLTSPLNIEVKTANEFLADAIELDTGLAIRAVAAMRARLTRPPFTAERMLLDFEQAGLTAVASVLRPFADSI